MILQPDIRRTERPHNGRQAGSVPSSIGPIAPDTSTRSGSQPSGVLAVCSADGMCTQAPGRPTELQLFQLAHRALVVAVVLPFLTVASPAAASPPREAAVVVSAPARLAPALRASRDWFRPARQMEVSPVPVEAAVKSNAKPTKSTGTVTKSNTKTAKPAVKTSSSAPKTVRKPAVEAVTVPASGDAAAMVRFVLAQVGESYRLGASGPSVWDCSGLSQAAARLVGVSLPHDADAQRRYGRAVTRAQLQPGDLVFWPGHVGVSIGGGMMVAAANSREGVVRQKIYGTPVAYRRLV